MKLFGMLPFAFVERTAVSRLAGGLMWLLTAFSRAPRILHVRTESMPWSSPPASLRRWAVTSVVAIGAVHAVSGATAPSISSALDVQVQVSTPFTYRITINQAWTLNSFDAKPLPAGLSLNKRLGIISGKPTAVGTNQIAISASQDNLPDRTLTDTLTLRVTAAPAPPLFSLDPMSTNVLNGTLVTLTSEAIGTGTIGYQWFTGFQFRGNTFVGDPIPGATNSSLTVRAGSDADKGLYFSSAHNSAGTNFSAAASIGVVLKPTIDYQPTLLRLHVGMSSQIYVSGYGGAELNFQWEKDGKVLTGATNNFIELSPVKPEDAGKYVAVLGNFAGQITSDPIVVQIFDPIRLQMTHTAPGNAVLNFNTIPKSDYSIYYLDQLSGGDLFWNYLSTVTAASTNVSRNVISSKPARVFTVFPNF
jgi:hypothetical protein